MSRFRTELYPDLSAFLKEIRENGISAELIEKIINKHLFNREYNKMLYERYQALKDAVPIFRREPRFQLQEVDRKKPKQINNKIIPVVVGVCGGILGAVALYVIPGFPANNIMDAIAIGIVNGLASTGVNQIYKQFKKE